MLDVDQMAIDLFRTIIFSLALESQPTRVFDMCLVDLNKGRIPIFWIDSIDHHEDLRRKLVMAALLQFELRTHLEVFPLHHLSHLL